MTTAILTKPRFSAATYGFAPGQTWTVGRDKDQMRATSHVKRTITSNTTQMVNFNFVQANGVKGESSTHIANFVTWIETHRASAKKPRMAVLPSIVIPVPTEKEEPALNTATVTASNLTQSFKIGQTWTRTRQTTSGRIHKSAHLTRTILGIEGNRVTFEFITAEGVKDTGESYLASFLAWQEDNRAVEGTNTITATVAKVGDVLAAAQAAGVEPVAIAPIPPAPRVLPSTGTSTVFLVNGVKVVGKTLVEAVTKFVSYNPEATSLNVEPTDERIIV